MSTLQRRLARLERLAGRRAACPVCDRPLEIVEAAPGEAVPAPASCATCPSPRIRLVVVERTAVR